MRRDSAPWGAPRGLACALVPVLALGAAGCDHGTRTAFAARSASTLAVSVLDTLVTPSGYAVGTPVWIARDAAGRFVVADQSDKALKLFAPSGTAAGAVGRPGSGPGEFTILLGGGVLGDSLFGYDFDGGRFTVFTPAGRYARSTSLLAPGTPMPATVRAVDDSLLLVAGFAIGAHRGDLVRLLGRDGRTRGSFLNLRRYFTPENADLVQASATYADAGGGTVWATVMGLDSVYAFDYAGRRLGAGQIRVHGEPLPTFRALIEANHGKRFRPDRSLVYQNQPAVVALAAIDATHAVLQVMPLDYGSDGRLDRSAGGRFVLATLDPGARAVATTGARELEGVLAGRDGRGSALVARYLGEDFDRIEVTRLSVAPAREGGR